MKMGGGNTVLGWTNKHSLKDRLSLSRYGERERQNHGGDIHYSLDSLERGP